MAQQPSVVADMRQALTRLDRLLATAREVVNAFDNPEARKLLHNAEALRKKAALNLSNHLEPRRIYPLIREATRLAEKAIEVALKPALTRLRNQLEDLMRRAENEVIGSGNREAERLVQEAKKNQQLGIMAIKARNVKAVEHFRVAITLLERALKMVRGRDLAASPGPLYERAKDYFLELEAQAREALAGCSNSAAMAVFDQGRRQAQRAEEAFRRGRFVIARQLYNDATRLLLRSVDLCRPKMPGRDRLKSELQLLNEAIATVEQQVAAQDDPRLTMLLNNVRRFRRDAEAAIARGNFDRALRLISHGRRVIDRILRTRAPGLSDFDTQCQAELQELQAAFSDLEGQIRNAKNPEARILRNLARKAYSQAEKICRRPKHSLKSVAAFRRMVQIAYQFLVKAEAVLQNSSAGELDRPALQQRLQQLEATIDEVRSNLENDPTGFVKILLDQALQMRDRARTAYERGHLNVSAEAIAIAFDLLRDALKLAN